VFEPQINADYTDFTDNLRLKAIEPQIYESDVPRAYALCGDSDQRSKNTVANPRKAKKPTTSVTVVRITPPASAGSIDRRRGFQRLADIVATWQVFNHLINMVN